jgi:hypothetical protein
MPKIITETLNMNMKKDEPKAVPAKNKGAAEKGAEKTGAKKVMGKDKK